MHAKKLQKEVEVKLHLFFTSALYGQIRNLGLLLPGKKGLRYPLSRRLFGSRSDWMFWIREISEGNKKYEN